MRPIAIAGAGAFGTALAIALSKSGRKVRLIGRDCEQLLATRMSKRLPHFFIPEPVEITEKAECSEDEVLLLAVPMQSLNDWLGGLLGAPHAMLACCKGIDLKTLNGPSQILSEHSSGPAAIMTGPSFAEEIAKGLPTALTLATDHRIGPELQSLLSTDTLRVYLSDDPRGAELGGGLKNVVAIACGIAIGAGFGESARAALMTRGFAEISRIAETLGARRETLAGLSGLGDLMLTCSSKLSRNYSFGIALGAGIERPQNTTVEGIATTRGICRLASEKDVDMPIANTVRAVIDGELTSIDALEYLLSRPLAKE